MSTRDEVRAQMHAAIDQMADRLREVGRECLTDDLIDRMCACGDQVEVDRLVRAELIEKLIAAMNAPRHTPH